MPNFNEEYLNDITDPQERRVAQFLGELPRAEAPKDFDLRLRGRIATARPSEVRPVRLFPVLKYAMPLAAVLFVAAGIMLYLSSEGDLRADLVPAPSAPASAPVALDPRPESGRAGSETAAAPAASPGVVAGPGLSPSAAPVRSTRPAAVPVRGEDAAVLARPDVSSTSPAAGGSTDFIGGSGEGGSEVFSIRPAPAPLTPRGVDLAPAGFNIVLERINASAAFIAGAWRIRSVRRGGFADQIGLRAGDELIAVNGAPVGERSVFDAGFTIRTIQVRRDGKVIALP